MNRLAWVPIVLVLSGCVLGGGETSRVERVPEELRRPRLVAPRVPDRHPFGSVGPLHRGEWATYREGERTFTLADVDGTPDGVWIEVIEETEPRQVSARLVDRQGVVRKAYYCEISKDGRKSTVEPQTLEQSATLEEPRRTEAGREVGEETVAVGGRELRTRRVAVRWEDLEGRLTQEITLWSPAVPPIYQGTADGGLVRRQSPASTIVLVAFGSDARPLLDLPP